MRLQLALDLTDLGQALRVAGLVAPYADIIEAGTPLLKAVGLDAVRALDQAFPGKVILADMKTMDRGSLEVEMAARAGARVTTVMAAAPDATIKEVVRAGRELAVKVVGDLLGVEDPVGRGAELVAMGVRRLLVHTGIDEQRQGLDPLAMVRLVAHSLSVRLSVGGGLDWARVSTLSRAGLPGLDVVVVGGAVTCSSDPEQAVRQMRQAIEPAAGQ